MIGRIFGRERAKRETVINYGSLYFDHLKGEMSVLKKLISDEHEKELLNEIQTKRDENNLTWDDIYAYQLVLLEYLDTETLKNKTLSLRTKYKSLVDPIEYAEYMKLRAVDLSQSLPEDAESKLKADFKYLTHEFYLRYAYLSVRENLRNTLLKYGMISTVIFFTIAAVLGSFSALNDLSDNGYYFVTSFSTLSVIIFAGVTGAFVSMQMRLQSDTSQGDPIYNLALLTHSKLSIFSSPLSGAIFAVVLYLFFVSGLLTGAIFPKIIPENANTVSITAKEIPDEDENVNGTSDSGEPNANANLTNSNNELNNTPEKNPENTSVESNTEPTIVDSSEETTSSNEKIFNQNLAVRLLDFVKSTNPTTGKDYALLLIWSFIAGFAERFVPDTLMRLVNQKRSEESTN